MPLSSTDPTYGGLVGNIALPPFVRGDSWLGFTLGPFTQDDGGINLPVALASARMSFRRYPDSTPAFVLVTGTPGAGQGQLVIVNATTWTFGANPQPLLLEAGDWGFDVETTDVNGSIWTPVIGTLSLPADYSHA